jgi:hypothetical protein
MFALKKTLEPVVTIGSILADMNESKKNNDERFIGRSEITCPECGHKEMLIMPTDACLWFHECSGCHTLLKPKQGDCCVFCSYGSVPCPPIQLEGACHTTGDQSCGAN